MRSAAIAVVLAAVAAQGAFAKEARRMSRAVLEDKVRGGWAGQMIGVAYGAPTEFKSNGKINEAELTWTPDMITNTIHQDDLYVEMTFAEVMDRVGLDATTEQYGEMFRDSKYALWHANAGARRMLALGVKAPLSGHPKYNVHANDIDFQIESDFIGLMTPGLPRESNKYADRVGRVMNYGDGLYGGMLFGAMYSAAFFETDPHRVVEQGLRSIPAESGYARVVRDVLAWHREDPKDWRKAWAKLQDKWDRDDVCPDGAHAPFNIDARLNGAYVVLGLLYGDGDFAKTMEISTRAGQDSDCNPSSAAGILGVMMGYEAIPAVWTSSLAPIVNEKFSFTQYSFNDIVASTLKRAEKVIVAAGGQVTPTEVVIPAQEPQAPPLEQWDSGVPVARVDLADAAWAWKGGWTTQSGKNDWSSWTVRAPGAAGDEVTLSFDGTGLALLGRLTQEGGQADVWLDGAPAQPIDSWIPENTHDNALWHVTGLAPGKHTVRVVYTGKKNRRSKGTKLEIERAVVYAASPAAR
jgi:hypothetical protein